MNRTGLEKKDTINSGVVSFQLEKIARRRRYIPFALALVTALIFALFFGMFHLIPGWFTTDGGTGETEPNRFSMGLFAAALALGAGHFCGLGIRQKLRCAFGREVLAPLAAAVPGLRFLSDESLKKIDVEESLLFEREEFNGNAGGRLSLDGQGSAVGESKSAAFRFAPLRVGRTFRHGCRLRGVTEFGGVFLRLDLPESSTKTFDGLTVAAPRSGGLTAELLQARLPESGGHSVAEADFSFDPAFDRWFIVLTSDASRAAEILTTECRERLLRLLENEEMRPSFSRIGTRVFLTLETARRWFEPPDVQPLTHEAAVTACGRYREDFSYLAELAGDFC